VSFWGAVIVAQNLGLVATCFSYITFLSSIGMQFWLLAAVLHAADAQSRAGTNRPSGHRRPWRRQATAL
jgi:hypothetical protein